MSAPSGRPVVAAVVAAAGALALAGCRWAPPARDDGVGPLPLYRAYVEGGERKPLPPAKDLWLEAWVERGRSGDRIVLCFSKVSSKEKTGPRLFPDDDLRIVAGRREWKLSTRSAISSLHPRLFFERVLAPVPIADFRAMMETDEVRDAARVRGHARPIAEFASWLRSFPQGPAHADVVKWMEKVSGLDIGREEQAVPADEVLRYHETKWRDLGWKD